MWDWSEGISTGLVRLIAVLSLIGAPVVGLVVFYIVPGWEAFVWGGVTFLWLLGVWAVLNTLASISVRLRQGTIGEDAPLPQPAPVQPQPYEGRQIPPVIR